MCSPCILIIINITNTYSNKTGGVDSNTVSSIKYGTMFADVDGLIDG